MLFVKENFILKFMKSLVILVIYLKYLFKNLKNYSKILFKNSQNNFYIPNLAIKNIIYINPNKIKYINQIPMKFKDSTKFILEFDWGKNNRLLEKVSHPTYITCYELFVEGKKIEECKNFFYFKDQIMKKKIYKNCKNDDDIIRFYKKKIILFESIKKFGIKKNFLFNIQFMIDKNFNLVKINSGNHRIAISRILKINKIPIEIKVIHSDCFDNEAVKNINSSRINKIIKDIEKKYS